MLTERDLLQAVRATLANEATVPQLACISGEALADHVAELDSAVGRLAVTLVSLSSELRDGALSASAFRDELRALLGPQLVQAKARLPGAYHAVATGASSPLTTLEYHPAAE